MLEAFTQANELSFACEAQHVSGSPFNFICRRQCCLLFQSSGYETRQTRTFDAVNAYLAIFVFVFVLLSACAVLSASCLSHSRQQAPESPSFGTLWILYDIFHLHFIVISQEQLLLPMPLFRIEKGLSTDGRILLVRQIFFSPLFAHLIRLNEEICWIST